MKLNFKTTFFEQYQALDPRSHKINLSNNDLGSRPADVLAIAIKLIPERFTHLDLSNNNLARFSPEDLILILKAIPENITHLNLSNNNLNKYFVTQSIDINKRFFLPAALTVSTSGVLGNSILQDSILPFACGVLALNTINAYIHSNELLTMNTNNIIQSMSMTNLLMLSASLLDTYFLQNQPDN